MNRRPLFLALTVLVGVGVAWLVPREWVLVPALDTEQLGTDPDTRYACPMFCTVLDELPKDPRCPVCGMELSPVGAPSTLDAHERWIMGLQVEPLGLFPLAKELRLFGEVEYDERRLSVVTARAAGWIEKLAAKITFEEVEKGEVLYELYSPEVYQAQQELLTGTAEVKPAARERLELLGIADSEVQALLAAGRPLRRMPYRAQSRGVIVRHSAEEGSFVKPGTELFALVDLERVWVQFEVFESEARWLELNREVVLKDDWGAGGEWKGTVVFIDPIVDRMARTQRIRVEVENRRRDDGSFALAPGRRISAWLSIPLDARGLPTGDPGEQALGIPRGALLRTGERDVIFVGYREVEDENGNQRRDYAIDPSGSMDDIGYEMVEVEVGELARRVDSERLERFYPLVRVVPPAREDPASSGLTSLHQGHLIVVEGAMLLDSQAQLAGRRSSHYPFAESKPTGDGGSDGL